MVTTSNNLDFDDSCANVTARGVSLVRGRLYLHQFTRLSRRSGGDDQIALLRHSVALCNLPYRSDRIDDSRTSRIGHEPNERLKTTATVRIVREREDKRLLGR